MKHLSEETIKEKIRVVHGYRVILDQDLANLYGVPLKRLNEQVQRNRERFPNDFVFQLTKQEFDEINLKSQNATSSSWGGKRKLPFVFTEHGAIMAANILRSPSAIQMSIFVVRAFTKLREMVNSHRDLALKLKELEQKVGKHDEDIQGIIQIIQRLIAQEEKPKRRMGFHND